MRMLGLLFLLACGPALAQAGGPLTKGTERAAPPAQEPARPDEDALFGGEEPAAEASPGQQAPARPGEDALFGGEEPPAKEAAPAAATAAPADRDAAALEAPGAVSAFDSGTEVDDPLRIGGQLYLRSQASWSKRARARDIPLSLPTLVDAYLDAKPSDRIRGFVSGRLVYDASRALGTASSSSNTGSGQGSGTTTAGPGLFGQTRDNPAVMLDQAWLRFDVDRKVFLTVGKQHVRWGVSRFFIPTDFLSPQRRDPLAVFDARLGASMAKVHVPVESLGWNFYAIGLLDNAGPADVLGKLGGALRAEVLLGPAELGLGAVFVKGRTPRYAVNLSSPLGPVDVYAEVALRHGSDTPVYRLKEGFAIERGLDNLEPVDAGGWNTHASGGLTYSLAYSEQDTVTLGAEYAYNSLGADDSRLYPLLLAKQMLEQTVLFQPFYVARHYGALYAVFVDPGPLEHTQVVLSNLANLSDRSAVARLDVLYRALQYLQVEAFASVNYGRAGGEFRYGGDLTLTVPGQPQPVRVYPPVPVGSFGLGLRINI